MAVNRLKRIPTQKTLSQKLPLTDQKALDSDFAADGLHEAMEISLCDDGMCFVSRIPYQIGTVLVVDFDPDCEMTDLNEISLQCEAMAVDCQRISGCQIYQITVLFTGN